MRITGGSLSGRKVSCPPGIIRPAMDRMRESFFAILGDLTGLSWLDLFSGSGIIALEAYSRGAYPIRCVEKDPIKREIIHSNVAIAPRRIDVSIMPVERFILAWKAGYDLVFLDPPFDYPYKPQLLQRLLDSRLLSPRAKVFMHFPDEDEIPPLIMSERLPAADQTTTAQSDGPETASTAATLTAQPAKVPARSLREYDRREYGRSIVVFFQLEGASDIVQTENAT